MDRIVGILLGAAIMAVCAYLSSPRKKDNGCGGNCSSCSGCGLSQQEVNEIKVKVKDESLQNPENLEK